MNISQKIAFLGCVLGFVLLGMAADCPGLSGGANSVTDPATLPSNGKNPIVVSVSAAKYHTCAVKSDGKTVCFGNPPDYKVGSEFRPQDVGQAKVPANLPLADKVFSSDYHNCIRRKADKQLACWEPALDSPFNFGQSSILMGKLAKLSATIQTDIAIESVSVGPMHTCVTLVGGKAYCGGTATPQSKSGQPLWNYMKGDKAKPITKNQLSLLQSRVPDKVEVGIPDLSGYHFTSLSSGLFHNCGISAGKAICWGIDNLAANFNANADNLKAKKKFPRVILLSDLFDPAVPPNIVLGQSTVPEHLRNKEVSAVATGYYHSCAIETVGSTVACWPPAAMPKEEYQASKIAAHAWNTCVILKDTHEVKCFALIPDDKINVGMVNGIVDVPTDLGPASDISVGQNHACAILVADGSLRCWGAKKGTVLGFNMDQAFDLDFGQALVPAELAGN